MQSIARCSMGWELMNEGQSVGCDEPRSDFDKARDTRVWSQHVTARQVGAIVTSSATDHHHRRTARSLDDSRLANAIMNPNTVL